MKRGYGHIAVQQARLLAAALVLAALLLVAPLPAQTPAAITSPAAFLGFTPGEDFRLADAETILAYFRLLDRQSPRLQVQRLGQSTQGRSFWMAVISSPENLANQETLIQLQAQLADPRELVPAQARRLMRDARAVVCIACSIHPIEIGPSQMSMNLAYHLLSDNSDATRAILDQVILLLIPTHNPDGLDAVVEWYKKYRDTPFAGGPVPFLDHPYAGHDINRDWVLLSQRETRLTVEKVYNLWHPHVVFDLHQMGYTGPRMFLPPYQDPYDDNIPPLLQAQTAALGTAIAAEMTAAGMAGVAHAFYFDAFASSRAYLYYHGGIRLLGEIAAARLATPLTLTPGDLKGDAEIAPLQRSWRQPLPWQGGIWRLGHIVDYAEKASMALLDLAARDREVWLERSWQVQSDAVAPGDAREVFVLPPRPFDPHAQYELLSLLQLGQVELFQAKSKVVVSGTLYPEESYLVPTVQPNGGWARTLLQTRLYIADGAAAEKPYDVSSYNLAYSFGVKVLEGRGEILGDIEKVGKLPLPAAGVIDQPERSGFFLDYRTQAANRVVNRLLAAGVPVYWLKETQRTAREVWPAGSCWIVTDSLKLLQDLARIYHVTFSAGKLRSPQPAWRLRAPRIGLYTSYLAESDEGWTRFVLESNEFPYDRIINPTVQRGDLRRQYDVIILPSQPAEVILEGAQPGRMPELFNGGIGAAGSQELRLFVESGGTLIALNRACGVPLQWELPVRDVTAAAGEAELFVPGAFLRATFQGGHPLGYGMPTDLNIFFHFSPAFVVESGEAVLVYPNERLLQDGYARGEGQLTGRAALAWVPRGEGHVELVGFRPQFRAQTRATFKVLFNGLLLSAASEAVCP
ncbi:MAG TPA: M14 family zinc carboxypeptidase [bacterium]|nr:M14 family zinc carboxypeptidase [bacterium]